MLFTNLTTLNNRRSSPDRIEKKFEQTRSNYLRDLDKLRKKYASTFNQLSTEWEMCQLTK